jgi:hypothetical protein
MSDLPPRHIDATEEPTEPPSENPYRMPFGISMSFPEVVVIKMVDATALTDYEFAVLMSSIFASATVGFFVAYLQSSPPQDSRLYGIVAIVFALCFVGFLVWAITKRRKMTARSRTLELQAIGTLSPSVGTPSAAETTHV